MIFSAESAKSCQCSIKSPTSSDCPALTTSSLPPSWDHRARKSVPNPTRPITSRAARLGGMKRDGEWG